MGGYGALGEQMIMPYCNSCLTAGRDIKACQFEAVQCQKSREVYAFYTPP
jgi:hypothetical protein